MCKIEDHTLRAMDATGIPRNRQGVVLQVGEVVDIKGGLFAVHSIGRKMITLRGLPATHIDE